MASTNELPKDLTDNLPKDLPKIQMPTQDDLKNLSKDDRLRQSDAASNAAASALSIVDKLKSKAAMLTDSRERSRILSEAFDREIEARGLTKKAKILKSGTFQGAAGGAGIGAATGIGLGTVVGTVVGTVASVPTTALGGLVGAGTGAIHGPWIKLGTEKGKDGKEEEKLVQVPQDAIDKGDVEVDDATGQVTAKDPEALKKSVENEEREGESKPKKEDDPKEKKRAPKLEVRSKKPSTESKKEPEKSNNVETAKRKPPKLGPKSGNQGATKTSKTPRGTNPAPKQKAPKLDVHAK